MGALAVKRKAVVALAVKSQPTVKSQLTAKSQLKMAPMALATVARKPLSLKRKPPEALMALAVKRKAAVALAVRSQPTVKSQLTMKSQPKMAPMALALEQNETVAM